jgi:hypothetical protein
VVFQGASHPAKVIIQRQPFEQNTVGRSDKVFGQSVWVKHSPLKLYESVLPREDDCLRHAADGYMDEADFEGMRQVQQLGALLGHGASRPANIHGPATSTSFDFEEIVGEFFDSFLPNQLDTTGVAGSISNEQEDLDQKHKNAWRVPFDDSDEDTPNVFRDLPDNGRRSPRSVLFCSMLQSGIHPHVPKLEQSEVCCSYEPASPEHVHCPLFDDEPLSDHYEAQCLSAGLELLGDNYHETSTKHCMSVISYGKMCDLLRDHGARHVLQVIFQNLEESGIVECYAEDICWDPALLEQLRETIGQHIICEGQSSTSAALNSAISDIEDEYLANEEEEEAASDLSISLQRLADDVHKCVDHSH